MSRAKSESLCSGQIAASKVIKPFLSAMLKKSAEHKTLDRLQTASSDILSSFESNESFAANDDKVSALVV